MAQCAIFEEDEVSVDTEKGLKYGLVLESAEYLSSDEEEEDTFWDSVKKGTVRVAWHPDGTEEVVPEKEVKLADRSLMPGDVVRRLIEGQDSQRGYVRYTTVICNVQILGKNKVICDIDSRELAFLDYWDDEQGDVYLDSWVGKVEKVTDSVVLRLPDGARVEASSDDFYTELSSFEDIHEKRERDTEFCVNTYYPGQRLKGYLGELEKVYWHVTTKNYSPEQAKKKPEKEVICTVASVEPEKIDVNWLCQGYSKVSGGKATPPPKTLYKDDVRRLLKMDCFEPCSVQIGDHAFYTLKEQDYIHNISQKGSKTLINYIVNNKLNRKSASRDIQVDLLNARNVTNSGEAASNKNCSSHMNENRHDSSCAMEKVNQYDTAILATASIIETCQDKVAKPAEVDRDYAKSAGRRVRNDGPGQHEEPSDHFSEDGRNTCPVDVNDIEVSTAEPEVAIKPEEEGDDEYDDVSDAESTASASSSVSTSSNPSKKKKSQHKKGGSIQTKLLKKKKLKKSKKKEDIAMWEFKPGDKIPVEVLSTSSFVEVMWQDGTIERGIKSTELYPIHHLDDQEFFPGDFVLPADGTEEHEYGIVHSVDHAGRTCVLKWIKPYVVGSAVNKPTERLESDEVSVYDIKDHGDYKFRPGVLVIRVGGSEEKNTVAAGQVYELSLDGRINVQWADRSRSFAYPQELYLIGDDLSELSEFEDDSDASSTETESESNKSWETETEEEVSCDDDEEEEEEVEEKSQRILRMDEAMKCFEAVIESLQNLEDLFALSDMDFCQSACFAEVVNLYKMCKKIDTKLNSSYFDDAKLRKYMSAIRDEMKKDKTAQFAKKIQELIEQNRAAEMKGDRTDKEGQTTQAVQSNMSNVRVDEIECNASSKSDGLRESRETAEKPTESGERQSPASEDAVYGAGVAASAVSKSDQGTQTSLQTDCGKCNTHTRELCQKAVHLLREIVIKIRAETAKLASNNEKLAQEHERLKEVMTQVETIDSSDPTCDDNKAINELKVDLAIEQSSQKTEELSNTPDVSSETRIQNTKDECENTESGVDMKGDRKDKLELTIPDANESIDNVLSPVTPQTPADVRSKILYNLKGFVVEESAPQSHKYIRTDNLEADSKFMSAVRKDHKILHSSLPLDIFVKTFEDRMDLFSVMIHGPKHTPYEDGLFFFDVKLPKEYPTSPPRLHYIAYCMERLNPNLYEDGKVCVSLLGTWTGKGTEVWNPQSTLLQVLISIQGLILVSEPYYNEAGYERQKGTQQGLENSRMYNEMALIKMIQSMMKMIRNPPEVFKSEVQEHIAQHGPGLIARLEYWLDNAVPASGSTIPIQDSSPKPTGSQLNATTASESVNQSRHNSSGDSLATQLFSQSGDGKSSDVAQGASPISNTMETRSESGNDKPGIDEFATGDSSWKMPEFPLLPVSKGFVLTLRKLLSNFRKALESKEMMHSA